jgi:hypothetical protein
MRGSPWGWGARWPALAVAGVLAAACAGPVAREGERWHARGDGASVADLSAFDPGWQRVDGAGALLAYRHAAGARAAWLHQCRGASAEAAPEARALLVRVAGAEVEREGPVTLAGREGWAVVARALEGDRPVTVKTVTRVSASACTDDFVLVAERDFAALEAGFDRWWASFAEGASG